MAVTARSSNHAVPVLPAAPAQIGDGALLAPGREHVAHLRPVGGALLPGVRSGPASSSESPPAAMNAPSPLRPAVRIHPLST